jgi:hypothetical protein
MTVQYVVELQFVEQFLEEKYRYFLLQKIL